MYKRNGLKEKFTTYPHLPDILNAVLFGLRQQVSLTFKNSDVPSKVLNSLGHTY